MERIKVITDNPHITGYIHGFRQEPSREVPERQQDAYKQGYRKGAKDSCKSVDGNDDG